MISKKQVANSTSKTAALNPMDLRLAMFFLTLTWVSDPMDFKKIYIYNGFSFK